MINILALLEFCEEPGILKILLFIQKILDIIFIIVPIGLIIMLSLDFAKNVINADDGASKTNKKIIERIIMTIFLFAVPYIIRIFISLTEDVFSKSLDYTSCLNNMNNISYFENIKEAQKKQEDEQKEREKEKNMANYKANQTIKNLTTSNPSYTPSGATFIGRKYTLTDNELKQIAVLCQREQSNAVGSAAEASLIANRYEIIAGKDSSKGSDLVNYVKTAGWWGKPASFMESNTPTESNVAAVKEVLVLGKRTLPFYVDEHDCIDCGSYGYDIIKIETDGKVITTDNKNELKNHNNYVSGKTIIYNKYGATYTFYTFPTDVSDPFGYTKIALDKYNNYNNKLEK